MSNTPTESNGSCNCGKVRIAAPLEGTSVGVCHCSSCRNWGGGPYFSVQVDYGVSIAGEDNVSLYNSSEWAERGFCKHCGSHLFYRLKQNMSYFIAAGIFKDQEFPFSHQVFIDEKPKYYCFANETHDMTAAQVFEQFAPQ